MEACQKRSKALLRALCSKRDSDARNLGGYISPTRVCESRFPHACQFSCRNTTSVTDPNGNQASASFDSERRLTQTTAPSPFSYQTKLFYDANSNVTKMQKQVTSEPAWQTATFTYSVTDKKLTATNPVGKISTWAFDGADRLQSFTDAQSRQYQYAYDALNRLYTVTDPTSTVCDTRTYTTNGLLYQRTDARSKMTTYSYDGFDRLNKRTFADSTFEQNSSYDANGNVLTYVTRSGNTITMTWDVLNRLSTRTPQGQATYTMSYDLAGRLTKANKPVVSGDPSTGDFQFSFDTAGRFYQEQYPDGKQVTHILDSNGNRTRTTWPDSYYITRVFDQLNRVTDIKLNGSGMSAAHFDYDQLSRRTKLTYSNGANVCYSWAPNDDLAALVHNFASSAVGFNMGYNHVSQLVGNNPNNGSYAWHPSGGSTVNYGTADNANKYPTVGGVSYSYDGNMNLTGDGVWTFGYNTENQLTSASKTGVSASYLYDPTGRQSQKTVGATKTRFIYDGSALIADYDTSGNLLNRYVHGGVDEAMIQIAAGGTISFFHHDNQNSVVAITDNSGAATNQYAYSPWGEITSLSGTPFGYTGQRYDAESGLHYYKARYLSNSLGRFLQCDPIGYAAGGQNLFTYGQNAPFDYLDPTGLQANQIITGVSASKQQAIIDSKAVAIQETLRSRNEINGVVAPNANPGTNNYVWGVLAGGQDQSHPLKGGEYGFHTHGIEDATMGYGVNIPDKPDLANPVIMQREAGVYMPGANNYKGTEVDFNIKPVLNQPLANSVNPFGTGPVVVTVTWPNGQSGPYYGPFMSGDGPKGHPVGADGKDFIGPINDPKYYQTPHWKSKNPPMAKKKGC